MRHPADISQNVLKRLKREAMSCPFTKSETGFVDGSICKTKELSNDRVLVLSSRVTVRSPDQLEFIRHFADPMMETSRDFEGNEGVYTFINAERDWCSMSIWESMAAMNVWVNSDLHKIAMKVSTNWIMDCQFIKKKMNKALEEVTM